VENVTPSSIDRRIFLKHSLVTGSALLVADQGLSLTCYVTQGMIGMPLFYGCRFALYRYLGSFYSVLVGIVPFIVQCAAAHFWLRSFRYGPLEWLWRACTFGSLATPMRRDQAMPAAATGPTPALIS